jgi:hypothetical protein
MHLLVPTLNLTTPIVLFNVSIPKAQVPLRNSMLPLRNTCELISCYLKNFIEMFEFCSPFLKDEEGILEYAGNLGNQHRIIYV